MRRPKSRIPSVQHFVTALSICWKKTIELTHEDAEFVRSSSRLYKTQPAARITGGVIHPAGREGDEVCTPHHAYLHDGRARSIDEAIRRHGGESQDSYSEYQALSGAQRQLVPDFLVSLQYPTKLPSALIRTNECSPIKIGTILTALSSFEYN